MDVEVLHILDNHLRGHWHRGRRQFRHDGQHLRLDAVLGGPVPDIVAAGQIDQALDPVGHPEEDFHVPPGRHVPDVLVLLHVGQGQYRDDEQLVAELSRQVLGDRHCGVPDRGQQARLGDPAPFGHEAEFALMDDIRAALHLGGECGDRLGPDQEIDLFGVGRHLHLVECAAGYGAGPHGPGRCPARPGVWACPGGTVGMLGVSACILS